MNLILQFLTSQAPSPITAAVVILYLLAHVAIAWLDYRRERLQLEAAERRDLFQLELRYRRERLWLEAAERLAHEHGPGVIDSLALLVHGPTPIVSPEELPRAGPPELPPNDET